MSKYANLFDGVLTQKSFEELLADTYPGVATRSVPYREVYGNDESPLVLYYYDAKTADCYGSTVEHLGTFNETTGECWLLAVDHPELAEFK